MRTDKSLCVFPFIHRTQPTLTQLVCFVASSRFGHATTRRKSKYPLVLLLQLTSLCHTRKPERIWYQHKQKKPLRSSPWTDTVDSLAQTSACQLFIHPPLRMAVDVRIIHENSLAYPLVVETTVLLSVKNMIQNMINTQMIRVSAE